MMKNYYLLVSIVALSLICGCGGGGGDGSIFPQVGRDMTGDWEGSITTKGGDTYASKFELSQSSANITGAFLYKIDDRVNKMDDVNGTIIASTVNISAIYLGRDDPDFSLEYIFEGTVGGDTYSGNFSQIVKNSDNPQGQTITGTFSFSFVAPDTDEAFAISFEWGDIPLCTSGNPNVVNNPQFVLQNVPQGTASIEFTMTDLDVPTYDHGGGTVQFNGQNTILMGAFTYNSPCPPNGSHRYEWTATARNNQGNSLATARATRNYPE